MLPSNQFEAPKSGIIILDCDEVLLSWDDGFRKFLMMSGRLELDPGPQLGTSLEDWLFTSRKRALEWIGDFNDQPGTGFDRLLPVSGAVEGVMRLREAGYRLMVLTACSDLAATLERRHENLVSIFGDVFEEVRGVPVAGSKLGELKRHGPSILIDDNVKNAEAARQAGHDPVIMRASHNSERFSDYHAGYHGVDDWEDFLSRCAFLPQRSAALCLSA
ncbi:hypothetical protein ACEUZ9_002891 [Paracoccus litorisediminis]|uniref:hypothetical protein n=1 Tax=Paracoccus litorisediminis TaxID=2006130 RepID=UPI00373048E1